MDMAYVVHDEPGPRTGRGQPGIGGFHAFGLRESAYARAIEQPTGILLPFLVAQRKSRAMKLELIVLVVNVVVVVCASQCPVTAPEPRADEQHLRCGGAARPKSSPRAPDPPR